jgi:hypothetical protein
MKSTFKYLAIISITLLTGCLYISKGTDKSEVFEAFRRGEIIIDALDKYKTDNNKYPESDNLEVLVSKYLKEIPTTGITVSNNSRKFIYTLDNDKEGFSLSFYAHFNTKVKNAFDWDHSLSNPTIFEYNSAYNYISYGTTLLEKYQRRGYKVYGNYWVHR